MHGIGVKKNLGLKIARERSDDLEKYGCVKIKNRNALNSDRGAVALSSILILSMIMLVMGLAMAFSEFIQSDIVYNQNKASDAFYAAESGARDAIQKISKNKDYPNGSYCLLIGNNRADIAVARIANQVEVISRGISGVSDCASQGSNYKRIKAILDVDINGKVTIASWEELAN